MAPGKRTGNIAAWRLHDLRRTMATYMEELGIPPHIVGSVLNHSPRGFKGVTSVYTRGDLVYERRKALVAWARFLSLLIDRRIGEHMLKLLRPTNEVDAHAKDRLQSLLQADAVTWERNWESILSIATH